MPKEFPQKPPRVQVGNDGSDPSEPLKSKSNYIELAKNIHAFTSAFLGIAGVLAVLFTLYLWKTNDLPLFLAGLQGGGQYSYYEVSRLGGVTSEGPLQPIDEKGIPVDAPVFADLTVNSLFRANKNSSIRRYPHKDAIRIGATDEGKCVLLKRKMTEIATIRALSGGWLEIEPVKCPDPNL